MLTGRCDGVCRWMESAFKSFSQCENCIDVAFCEACLCRLREGTGTFRICDPTYPMIEVYPPRGLVTRSSRGYMVNLDGEQPIGIDTWLGRIKREWEE